MKDVPPHLELLFTPEQIRQKVEELGRQITQDYQDKNLLVVGILRGATVFLSDLIRNFDLPDMELDYMAVSSYGPGTVSSGQPKIVNDMSINPEGRHVLIVEDIVDTGYSLQTLLGILAARNPASLKTCALLSKPERREVEVPIDYLGFTIENLYVVGYGLDSDQKSRGYPFIAVQK